MSKVLEMSDIDFLSRVIAELDVNGWTKGTMQGEQNQTCLLGAAGRVVYHDLHDDRATSFDALEEALIRVIPQIGEFYDTKWVDTAPFQLSTNFYLVTEWNDQFKDYAELRPILMSSLEVLMDTEIDAETRPDNDGTDDAEDRELVPV